MIEILPELRERKIGNGDDICHYYCSNIYPNAAGKKFTYCGADITGEPDTDDEDEMPCSMCMEVCNPGGLCPLCGEDC